jgi:small subunit ribosomal protein S16
MVKIRLTRTGMKKAPSYRIVVADARTEPSTIVVDEEKALKWLLIGAQPSDSVRQLFERNGINAKFQQRKSAVS